MVNVFMDIFLIVIGIIFFIVMGVSIIVLLFQDTQTFKAIDKRIAQFIGGGKR